MRSFVLRKRKRIYDTRVNYFREPDFNRFKVLFNTIDLI